MNMEHVSISKRVEYVLVGLPFVTRFIPAATAGLPSPSHSRPFTRTRRSEDYLWARAVVQTRSFYLGAERILLPGADLSARDPRADFTGRLAPWSCQGLTNPTF